MRGGPEGALYGFNKSGWMLDINFENYFIDVFLPKTAELAGTDDRLLIYDGHNSHITFKTAKAAMENKVHILCLPPHSSHALQPLDVSVFFLLRRSGVRFASSILKTTQGILYQKKDSPHV